MPLPTPYALALLALFLAATGPSAQTGAEHPGQSRHERLGILLGTTRVDVEQRERPAPDAVTDTTLTYYDDIGPFETVTYGFTGPGLSSRLRIAAYVGYARDPVEGAERHGWVERALRAWLGEPTFERDGNESAPEGAAAKDVYETVWWGVDVAARLALEEEAPGASTYFLVLSYFTLPDYAPPPDH